MKPNLFGVGGGSLAESVAATADQLREYGPRYDHWQVAYSGGKDSTCLATVVAYLVETGAVPAPRRLSVVQADTMLELPPLDDAARRLLDALTGRGHDAGVVTPPLDHQFVVYIFGRGVPPPSNTFRWCTDRIKIAPMRDALALAGRSGKTLVLTGVRLGESAKRDQTIAASCSRDGAECGQGRLHLALANSKTDDINQYFIPGTADAPADTLAPILHWRVCQVWDWLDGSGQCPDHGYLDCTGRVADAYGDGSGSKRVEEAARTGCVGCNLASRDVALERLVRRPDWSHLSPLMGLRPLWAWLKRPENRLRKPGGERRADGELCANQNRMGPLTMAARVEGLARLIEIEGEVNRRGRAAGRPEYRIVWPRQRTRIAELIAAGTWPDGWTGREPRADEPYTEWRSDGSIQLNMFDQSDPRGCP